MEEVSQIQDAVGQGPLITVITIAVAAIGAIWKVYSDRLKKTDELYKQVIADQKETIIRKESQIEKASERLQKYSEVLRDVSTMLGSLNQDHRTNSSEMAGRIDGLKDTLNSGVSEIKSMISNMSRKDG